MEAIEPNAIKPKKNKAKKNKSNIKQIKGVIDGSVLINQNVTQQLPYILFLAFLAIIYIGNRYSAEQMVRKIDAGKNELKELRSESIATASVLMLKSKQITVANETKKRGMGLIEAHEPPQRIIVSEKEYKKTKESLK